MNTDISVPCGNVQWWSNKQARRHLSIEGCMETFIFLISHMSDHIYKSLLTKLTDTTEDGPLKEDGTLFFVPHSNLMLDECYLFSY